MTIAGNANQRRSEDRAPTALKSPEESPSQPWADIAAHLSKHGIKLQTDPPPRQFAGGLANLNFMVWVDDQPAVFRRPPSGVLPPGAHDMKREHRVLSRLWKYLDLVPRGIYLCEDETVISVPFQLIEYRDGLIVRGDDLSPVEGMTNAAYALSETVIDTLVAIHNVDVVKVGLESLGKPVGFLERAVKGWSSRSEAFRTAGNELLVAEICRWLASRVPNDAAPTLLHNDIKLDNIILDPGTLRPRAVVDWDMGTLGDPLFDLATTLSYWTESGDPDCMHRLQQMPSAAPGFLSREEVAVLYAERAGRPLGDFTFYRVLTIFKLGVIFHQLHDRYQSGAISSPKYADFNSLADEIFEFAADVMHGRLF